MSYHNETEALRNIYPHHEDPYEDEALEDQRQSALMEDADRALHGGQLAQFWAQIAPNTRNKKIAWTVFGILVVVGGVTAAVVLTRGDDSSDNISGPSPPSPAPTPFPTPDDGTSETRTRQH